MAMTKDPFVATLDLKSVQTLSCAGAVLGDETQNILQGILGSVSVIQGYG
jgi:long-subunit acyl-CoA synthetase (AMP-forming)